MKKVCVITSTRADFGIMSPLIRRIAQDGGMEMQIVATGTHLSEQFGMTVNEIEAMGYCVSERIPILTGGDSPRDVSAAMANILNGMSAYLERETPDMAVVLGDRYEIFAACAACVNALVPIAHIHGGETTEGAADECFRHGITKMASLHFTSCEAYRRRVIQLGESPDRVFNTGAMGVENALNTERMTREALEESIGFDITSRPFAVVTFHPVTLERETGERQSRALFAALEEFPEYGFIMTKSNADAGGRAINCMIDEFAAEHCNVLSVVSLGMKRYMSALGYADMVIGNSSSGIIEAPSFGIPTVNIGDRQKGRVQAESVVNCIPEKGTIADAIRIAAGEDMRMAAKKAQNPYGDGHASEHIFKVLKTALKKGVDLKKSFYDIGGET